MDCNYERCRSVENGNDSICDANDELEMDYMYKGQTYQRRNDDDGGGSGLRPAEILHQACGQKLVTHWPKSGYDPSTRRSDLKDRKRLEHWRVPTLFQPRQPNYLKNGSLIQSLKWRKDNAIPRHLAMLMSNSRDRG